ncbi:MULTISPECIES: DUF760 domain-containing protein [unclassified Phormidesmis]
MQNHMAFNSDRAKFLRTDEESDEINALLTYLQEQPPEVLERIARSVSPQVKQVISHNVQGLVGVLPSEGFGVKITTDRENLANLLGSAMLTGYFLSQMEQRMALEESVMDSSS